MVEIILHLREWAKTRGPYTYFAREVLFCRVACNLKWEFLGALFDHPA